MSNLLSPGGRECPLVVVPRGTFVVVADDTRFIAGRRWTEITLVGMKITDCSENVRTAVFCGAKPGVQPRVFA